MGDRRAALDVQIPPHSPDLIPLIDALLDDFHPFAIEERDAGTRRVYFFVAGDRNNASRAVEGHFGASGVTTVSVEVPGERWAERSQASLRAVRVGAIIVAPPWDVPSNLQTATLVIIRPSMGFGTGHHASTRLCLHALQDLSVQNRTVLDLGTGSGILAIAAAKLGAASVVGIDWDLDAIATARDNLERNDVSSVVDLYHRDVRDAATTEPASIVLANLTGALVCRHPQSLLRCVTRGGVLVVSGVTEQEEYDVRCALAPHGTTTGRHTEGEWVALTIRRATSG